MANFYFISVPRTASNSIHEALAAGTRKYNHVPAKLMRERVGREAWNKAFTFGGARHPLARLVSFFTFCKVNKIRFYDKYDFPRWVRADCPTHHRAGNGGLTSSRPLSLLEFLADEKGVVLVQFVYRFERLQEDYDKICKRIGVKRRSLPRLAPGKTGNYKRWYTPSLRREAEKLCEADLAAFYPNG